MPAKAPLGNPRNARKNWQSAARHAFSRFREDILLLVIFLMLMLFFFGMIGIKYRDHRIISDTRPPVSYDFVGKSMYKGRRDNIYRMTIRLNGVEFPAPVSKEEFDQLDAGARPAVYVSSSYGPFSRSQLAGEQRNTRIFGSIAAFVALVIVYRLRGGKLPFGGS